MVKEKQVSLPSGHEGFLYEPQGAAAGTVILFHERYGLVRHTLDLARKLAENGYFTLAPDLFSLWDGDKQALNQGKARALISDDDSVRQIDLWMNYLKTTASAGGGKIALMGVCQSGRYPIVVGSTRNDIAAYVIFYGGASVPDWTPKQNQPRPMPEMIGKLSAPSLFVFAEKDHIISLDHVRRVRNTFEDANLSYRMKVYADAPHGFLNDTMPGRYRPETTREAWAFLLRFLGDVFNRGWPHGRVLWEFCSDKNRGYDFTKNERIE